MFWGYITTRSPAPTCRHWGLSHTGCILRLEINLIKPHPPTLDPGSPHSEGRRQQQGWGGGEGTVWWGLHFLAALGWESSLVAIHQPGLGTGSVGCCSSISKTMHTPGAAWPRSLGRCWSIPAVMNPAGGCSPFPRLQPPRVMDPHPFCDAPPSPGTPQMPLRARCCPGASPVSAWAAGRSELGCQPSPPNARASSTSRCSCPMWAGCPRNNPRDHGSTVGTPDPKGCRGAARSRRGSIAPLCSRAWGELHKSASS